MSPSQPSHEQKRQLPAEAGLLIVCGPPFGGKSPLASQLTDCFANAIKLAAVDNLSDAEEHWYPSGPTGERIDRPEESMLDAALRVWLDRPDEHKPTVVVQARFATRACRRRALAQAADHGVPFRVVEASSSQIRAMQDLVGDVDNDERAAERMRRWEAAMARYEAIDDTEARDLPALRIDHVLSDLRAAVAVVFSARPLFAEPPPQA